MNLRLVLSGACVLAAAGAVIGGVALAQSPSPHRAPAAPPAAVVSTTEAPPSVTVAATTSAAPVATHPRMARSTHHAVAPKETTVANQPAEQTSTSDDPGPVDVIPVVVDSNDRAGNAPPPPPVPSEPVAVPSQTPAG